MLRLALGYTVAVDTALVGAVLSWRLFEEAPFTLLAFRQHLQLCLRSGTDGTLNAVLAARLRSITCLQQDVGTTSLPPTPCASRASMQNASGSMLLEL